LFFFSEETLSACYEFKKKFGVKKH
jgi:hypothetical protein